jgi:hypothetical protein
LSKRYWRRSEVEACAWATLQEFGLRCDGSLKPPIDVDLIGELVYELTWDWAVIPEPPGRIIWAGLAPAERRVILNERHIEVYRRNEGFERFTKAHELGHWVCHVVHGGVLPPRPPSLKGRGSLDGPVFFSSDADSRWRERHADWFAAALLMPAPLLQAMARGLDLERWPDRYRLRDRFNVSITALNVRLADVGLVKRRGESRTDGV